MIKKIIGKIEAEAEKKSWQPEEIVYFDVGIAVRIKTKFGILEEWFYKSLRLQSKDYPRGITEANALKMGRRVYRRTVFRERIK